MCDFRGTPTGLYEFATGKEIPFQFQGVYSKESFKELPGIYHIPATGSFYSYFDGQQWWRNREDWGPPSKDYWPETGGIYPTFAKYVFLYPPIIPKVDWPSLITWLNTIPEPTGV